MQRSFSAAAAVLLSALPAMAAPEIGAPAPAFEGVTSNNEMISLDQFAGRNVVLEWTNKGCPFVKKHYKTGNMQATQAAAQAGGAVWITVISSAPGKQGHLDGPAANAVAASFDASPDYIILDESGALGRAYRAKTTPQMALIDGDRILRYEGAIDDKPSASHATVAGATNYLLAAFNNVIAGEPVATPKTKPYGCSVKYGS